MKLDIAELEALQAQATRHKVKDILSLEARRLVSDMVKLEEQIRNSNTPQNASSAAAVTNKRYQIKINNYGKQDNTLIIIFNVFYYLFFSLGSDIKVRKILCHTPKSAYFTRTKCIVHLYQQVSGSNCKRSRK